MIIPGIATPDWRLCRTVIFTGGVLLPVVFKKSPNIRELVTYTLQSTGFDACGFENGSEFLKALSDGEKPELVLLDIMLPGEDGISILGKLRKKSATRDLPIIMMTAKGTEYDKVLGLDSGADDYITKPFGMMELVSRVKAVLRRSSRNEKKDVVELVTKLYHLRTCNRNLPKDIKKERPCLYYQIHQCEAPCQGYISKEEYHKKVEELRNIGIDK